MKPFLANFVFVEMDPETGESIYPVSSYSYEVFIWIMLGVSALALIALVIQAFRQRAGHR